MNAFIEICLLFVIFGFDLIAIEMMLMKRYTSEDESRNYPLKKKREDDIKEIHVAVSKIISDKREICRHTQTLSGSPQEHPPATRCSHMCVCVHPLICNSNIFSLSLFFFCGLFYV
jgi:hypothetical protein